MSSAKPGKMDLTLVAYYGEKPPMIANLIQGVISKLSKLLGDGFIPYTLQQVHGTIIGLEGFRAGERIINANYVAKRNEFRAQNLNAALEILKSESMLPFDVIIGGFSDDGQYSLFALFFYTRLICGCNGVAICQW